MDLPVQVRAILVSCVHNEHYQQTLMNVKLILMTVILMLLVSTPLVTSHVPVTRATVEMDSPVQVRAILVSCVHNEHYQQTLMSVKLLMTVILMLLVSTPLVTSHVPVTRATVEMDSPVQVRAILVSCVHNEHYQQTLMSVKLLMTVILMLLVSTPLVTSHVPVTRATVEMDSPVQVRAILVSCVHNEHYQQTLMSVKLLMTVTLMLLVPTPLVVSHVPVTRATLEMDSPVQVRAILVSCVHNEHYQQTLMNVKLILMTVTLVLLVSTPLVTSHVPVTMATVEMDSPVQVRAILVSCVHNEHYQQTLMSVKLLMTVTLMLLVPTPLVVSRVPVSWDTVEMDSPVQVRAILVSCVHNEHYQQTLMSVKLLMTVTLMLLVSTPLVTSHVPVTMATVEME